MRSRQLPASKCFYFGCLRTEGHFLYTPEGNTFWNDTLDHVGDAHIDGALAPRKVRVGSKSYYKLEQPSAPIAALSGEDREHRYQLNHDSNECPQGQFLLHMLPNGFSAISWWDQCQGDSRPGSSSTIFLSGIHSAKEVLAAGKEFFPQVFERLEKKGVTLVDVTSYPDEIVVKKKCVTDDHTCVEGTGTTSPDDCKGCEAVEMLKSLP
jgi:hypothetical protein